MPALAPRRPAARAAAPCLVALALAACVRQEPLALPDLAGHRSLLVVITADGRSTAWATELDGGPLALPVGLDGSASTTLLLAAWDVPLAALKLSPGPVAVADADACGRHLPASAATWARALDAPASSSAAWGPDDRGTFAALRVRPTPGACPRLDEDGALSADLRCAPNACRAVVEQTDCTFTLDTALCRYGVLRGEVGANGELCFEPSPALGTCDEADPVAPASTALVCSGAEGPSCTIDLFGARDRPRFVVESRTLLDHPVITDPELSRPSPTHVVDLLALDDVLLVVVSPTVRSPWTCAENDLLTIDPDTLETVRTATLPPCMNSVRADPLGDGFVGLYGGDLPQLGRFDRAGHLLEHVAWSVPVPPGNGPTSMALTTAPDPVAVAAVSDNVSELPGKLFSVDLRTMRELPAAAPLDGVVFDVAPFDAHQVLVLDDTRRTVWIHDPRTGALVAGPTTQGTTAGLRLGQVRWIEAADRFALTVRDQSGGLYAFTPSYERTGRAAPYERYASVWALGPWPAAPELVTVALVDYEDDFTASIALGDPRVPRLLPGAEVVGRGPIERIVADRRGRVFALLAWSSELVRLTPTP